MFKPPKNFFLSFAFSVLLISAFAQFRVVGYLPTWSGYPGNVNSIGLNKITHLNIAFANPNSSGTLIPSNGTNADVVTVVNAAHAQNVKVLMSIGGWGAPGNTYKTQITNDQAGFVNKIVQYAVTNNLDGIDVDLEGDVLDGTILTATQYQNFVSALATGLHAQNKIITAALAKWFGNYLTTTALAQFDFISIMSYDAAMPPGTPAQHSPYSMATGDFQYFNTTKGVTATKLNIGVPFYGYGWGTYGDKAYTYCSIVTNNPGAENNDQVGSGNNVIYYNGIPTIKQKTNFALQNAGGVMIWELTQDCNNTKSLLLAIDQTVKTTAITNPEASSSLNVEVFPNPAADYSTIRFSLTENSNVGISLYDIKGSLVYSLPETSFIPGEQVVNLPLAPLDNGLYIVKVKTEKSFFTGRLVKNDF